MRAYTPVLTHPHPYVRHLLARPM